MKRLYITFHTTSEAMATERACKVAYISGRLVPAPRALTVSCGLSFETDILNEITIRNLLAEKNIEYDEIHIL